MLDLPAAPQFRLEEIKNVITVIARPALLDGASRAPSSLRCGALRGGRGALVDWRSTVGSGTESAPALAEMISVSLVSAAAGRLAGLTGMECRQRGCGDFQMRALVASNVLARARSCGPLRAGQSPTDPWGAAWPAPSSACLRFRRAKPSGEPS
jgi:hypothetical protein